MRRKYSFIACIMVLAAIYTYYFNINSYILISLGIILSLSLFAKNRTRLYLLLSVTIFFVTAIYTNYRRQSVFKNYKNEEKEYILRVENIKEYEGYSTFIASVKNVNGNTFNEKLKAYYSGRESLNNFDTIKVNSKLEDIRINANPNLFNEKMYYLTKNIKYKAKFKDFEKISWKMSLAEKMNLAFEKKLDALTENTMEMSNANFLKAIFMSNTNYLDEDELGTYRSVGLGHLLAVSGLHVSLISFAIIFILVGLGVSKRKASSICIIFLIIYGAVINYPVSFLRAMILFIALDLAFAYDINIERAQIISIALIITLLINPYYVFSVSLHLSYGAAYAIEIIFRRLKKLGDKKNKLQEGVLFVLAINLVLAPIQLYTFHEFNFVSLLTNLILLPIYSAIITVSFVILVISILISPFFILFAFVDYILSGLYKILLFVARVDILKVSLYNQDALILAYFSLLIAFYFANNFSYMKTKLVKFMLMMMAIITFTGSFIYMKNQKHYDTLNMISIGQEEAMLLDINNKKIMVDVAGDIMGTSFSYDRTLREVLKNAGVSTIDIIFISHFDSDHYGNLIYLLDDFKVKNICFYKELAPEFIKKEIISRGINYINPNNINGIDLGNDNYIKIVHRDRDFDSNNSSLLFVLKAHGTKTLFTGDIEREAEDYYIDKLSKIDILKVPHHGSKTSSSMNFLEKTMPKDAISSQGLNNSYGHPHEETLENFKTIGSNFYRTDRQGMISVIFSDGTYKIETFYKEYYNYLDYMKKYIFLLTLISIIFSYIISIIIDEYKKYGDMIYEL